MANDTNVKLRASMPIVYGSQVANHIPLIGIKRYGLFLEYVDQYLQTLSNKIVKMNYRYNKL